MLLSSKALIIVTLELEELLEVGLAIVHSLEGGEAAEREHIGALLAAEAGLVKGLLIR